jgi:cyclopropane-fatty-acyl-phospholipid synthase
MLETLMDTADASRQVYERLAARSTARAPRLRLWTGEEWGDPDAPATLVLQHPGAFRAMLLPPNDLSAGEAYIFDDIDIEGDMAAMLEFGRGLGDPLRPAELVGLYRLLRQLPADSRRSAATRPRMSGILHSLRRDREAIRYHYDTGNEFFAAFLDPNMVYSSAAFLTAQEPLEKAQLRKLDLICRKLGLRAGQRFLDVGCGWGALVVHAAREYDVTAVGVTLSSEQAAYGADLAKEAGVDDRVTILQRDYREVDGTFDAIASVGMFEHVGAAQLEVYFSRLFEMITPRGLLLNHGIVTNTRSQRRFAPSRRTFVGTYVFPDGELVPIEQVVEAAANAGFETTDAESLRTSYALTLKHWVANLEANRDEAVAAAGEQAYRIWRSYMAGSSLAFSYGDISVYQLLLAKPETPWTFGRRHLIAADDS